jgi:hypothetical protein
MFETPNAPQKDFDEALESAQVSVDRNSRKILYLSKQKRDGSSHGSGPSRMGGAPHPTS